jgi:hypothetical protein
LTESKLKTNARNGGKKRAASLTPERRAEIARQAALTRWVGEGKEPPALAHYGAPEKPLRIGDIEIPCYVLADGTRVLTQRGLQSGLGLSEGGGKDGARKLAVLMAHLDEKGIDTRDLVARANSPIRFIPPHGGNPADGYDAMLLPDICAVIIDAATQGKLHARQQHLAKQCAILQHGFATVGIVALIDEATGYQDVRARDALAKILEKFVAKELRPWVKTFPSAYYEQIYRLNGWVYSDSSGRPGVIGHWTNNIVYRRLAPGVLVELQKEIPRLESGRLKHKLFQRLTDDVGHPKLREHLAAVLMLMKYAPNWRVFMDRLDREFPQFGDNMLLPFPEGYEGPDVAH